MLVLSLSILVGCMEMDTDSLYMTLAGDSVEELAKPERIWYVVLDVILLCQEELVRRRPKPWDGDKIEKNEGARCSRGIRGATETATMFVRWDDTPCVYATLTGDTTPIRIPIGGFPSGIGIDR